MVRENFKRAFEKNQQLEKQMIEDESRDLGFEFEVQESKDGNKTIHISKNGKKSYMHSKYSPIKEAEKLIDKHAENIEDATLTIFYGLGLGYHIDEFVRKYPGKRYYIYEPIPELMKVYLESREIKSNVINNSEGISTGSPDFLHSYMLREVVALITLPSHESLFDEEFTGFSQATREITSATRDGVVTNLAYQNRWILNSIRNLKHVIRTPNIIDKKYTGEFKDKPVLLVSAGPSLNEDIEHIREVKNKGLAYIFAIGSAINTLIHNDIMPDMAFTYDPNEFNRKVFKKLIDSGVKGVPVAFGSSVGYETVEDLKAAGVGLIHFITSQDTISMNFLKRIDGEKNLFINDAPTIAVLTLSIAQTLGCNPIIFAGQNLAFKGDKRHSEGVDYSKEVSEEERKNFIAVKDVYGNSINTSRAYDSMKNSLERQINLSPDRTYINTTKGGAEIVGAEFCEIEKFMESSLAEGVVKENIFDLKFEDIYDRAYLLKRKDSLRSEWIRAKNIISEYRDIALDLKSSIEIRNSKNIQATYPRLDKVFKKMVNNEYFVIFIMPTVRVQYKLLIDGLKLIKLETNVVRQAVDMYWRVNGLLGKIEMSKRGLDIAYEEMMDDIEDYLR